MLIFINFQLAQKKIKTLFNDTKTNKYKRSQSLNMDGVGDWYSHLYNKDIIGIDIHNSLCLYLNIIFNFAMVDNLNKIV